MFWIYTDLIEDTATAIGTNVAAINNTNTADSTSDTITVTAINSLATTRHEEVSDDVIFAGKNRSEFQLFLKVLLQLTLYNSLWLCHYKIVIIFHCI